MGLCDHYDTRKRTIVELQSRIRACERGASVDSTVVFSTGCTALDGLFPGQGVRQGSIVEWLGNGECSGVGTISLMVARWICPAGRPLVLIDSRHQLYPLSLALLGFELSQLILIRPASKWESLWACEEALRCEAVGLVWANIEQLSNNHFRRLQLAAEGSSGIGFLVRSAKALRQPSWAEVKLTVCPAPSFRGSPCFRVKTASGHVKRQNATADIMIDRLRGTLHGKPLSENPLPMDSRLAITTATRHSAGA